MCNIDAKPDDASPGDVENDGDDVDTKAVGDTSSVPEETFDAENKSSDAGSVSKQGAEGETVDSELESKKVEDEKTEEKAEKAAADSTSTVKESSSVEGDDQKKRFVAFCLLENQNGYLLHWRLCARKIGCSFGGKLLGASVWSHLSFLHSHISLRGPLMTNALESP